MASRLKELVWGSQTEVGVFPTLFTKDNRIPGSHECAVHLGKTFHLFTCMYGTVGLDHTSK